MADYNGAKKLGFLLFGGADAMRAEAMEQGRLRTAQTETAIENARLKRLERVSAEAQETELQGLENEAAKAGMKNPALFSRLVRAGRGNSQQMTEAALNMQEFGNRDILGDADADPLDQFAAGQGVQGKVLSPLEMVGAGNFINVESGKLDLGTTPLGTSMIGENEATEEASRQLGLLREDQRINPTRYDSGSGEAKIRDALGNPVQAGFMPNPNYDPAQMADTETNPLVVPISGGGQDPNAAGKLGVRERAMVGSVLNAAQNTVGDIGSIMSLDVGVDAGFFGQGAMAPGSTLMDVVGGNLRRELNPESSNAYNAILGNLSNQLGRIEQMGYQVPQGLAEKFDALVLTDSDNVYTKMIKMSQMRQSVESAMDTLVNLNALPATAKTQAIQLRDDIRAVVPFTTRDVIALARPENEGKTLAQVMQEMGGGKIPTDKKGVVVTPSDQRRATTAPTPQPGAEGDAPADGSDIPALVVANGGGQYNAQGKVVDGRGWILRSSPEPDGSRSWAFVNPQNPAEWEPVAQ